MNRLAAGDRVETIVLGEWAAATLLDQSGTGAWRLRLDRPVVLTKGSGDAVAVLYRAPNDIRSIEPVLVPAERVRLAAARFVAEHWRDAALGWDLEDERIVGAVTHPLAMVLSAIEGEVDPVALGLSPDAAVAFRSMLAGLSGENASA